MRRFMHHMSTGWKGSGISVVTGAAAGIAAPYVMQSGPAFLQTNWWAMPAALLLVGHFLQRKNGAVGGALMGVAGYWAYSAYQAQPKAATPAAGTGAGTGAQGFIDAGALTSYNDSILTDASPRLGSAEAAMLYNPQNRPTLGAGALIDSGSLDEAMGLEG